MQDSLVIEKTGLSTVSSPPFFEYVHFRYLFLTNPVSSTSVLTMIYQGLLVVAKLILTSPPITSPAVNNSHLLKAQFVVSVFVKNEEKPESIGEFEPGVES